MLQHMMLSYFLPPLVLLATPAWLLRVLIGDGALYRVRRVVLTKPVVAGVVFNVVVMVTHIPRRRQRLGRRTARCTTRCTSWSC